jgi:RNA-directed DNA polymerase
LAPLQVALNEEKSRLVDLAHGEPFSFVGFDVRRGRRRRGVWRAWYPPRLKKRTALVRKLQEICRRHQAPPSDRGISLSTPSRRGGVRYCAVGDASRCLGCIKDGVEKKGRRPLRRARKRRGFGGKRWRRQGLYQRLGLFNHYRVQRPRRKALPS